MDEREELVWKRRVDFFFVCVCMCILKHLDLFFCCFVLDQSEKRRDFSDDKNEKKKKKKKKREERRKSSVKRPAVPFVLCLY